MSHPNPRLFLRGTFKVKSSGPRETGHDHSLECSNTGLHRARPVGQITCASPTSPSCHRIANTETASSLPLSHHAAQKHFLVLHCHHFITRPPNNVFVCRLAAIVPRKRRAAMICRSGLSKAHCQWTSHFLSAHEQPSNCYCYVVPHLQ